MRQRRENARLPAGAQFPSVCSCWLPIPGTAGTASDDLIVIATPMAALREMLCCCATAARRWSGSARASGARPTTGPACSEGTDLRRGRAWAADRRAQRPELRQEVAAGRPPRWSPPAMTPVCASGWCVSRPHGEPARLCQRRCRRRRGRRRGQNVMAIATGLCDGLDLGLNARAALITRPGRDGTPGAGAGRQGRSLHGAGGLGDLVLTATGDLSRNRQVGLLLARGLTLQHAVDSLGHVAEGVYECAHRGAARRAARHQMPITAAVVDLLEGRLRPDEAVAALMGRDPVTRGALRPESRATRRNDQGLLRAGPLC